MKTRFIPLTLILLLAACQGGPQRVSELPTVAGLPTQDATPFISSTLPDLWTTTPTATHTDTPTGTLEPSVTPSATITDTPTRTPTDTPTSTPEFSASDDLLALALQVTLIPTDPSLIWPVRTPTPTALGFFGERPTSPFDATSTAFGVLPTTSGAACPQPPGGGFATVYNANATLAGQLGCPQSGAVTVNSAYQPFQTGAMLWIEYGTPAPIFSFTNDGRFTRHDDTYNAATDPFAGGETPPQTGLVEPVRGFGKIWRGVPAVRTALGWGTGSEAAGQVTLQLFLRGAMLSVPQRGQILVLIYDVTGVTSGMWQSFPGGY